MSANNYTVYCLSEALSPITHNSGSAGNESLVMRESVVTPRGMVNVPVLSGNALRHRMIREPGARWLIDRYELSGTLSLVQLNYALHGGNLTEGGGRENTRLVANMQRLFPHMRLMGGSLPSQIVGGSLDAWRGTLICEENRRHLAAQLPDGWELPDDALKPAEGFVDAGQYTRGDAASSALDLLPEADLDGVSPASNLMIFAGQQVVRGACFWHGFTLKHASRLELGALLLAIACWRTSGGTIGGAAARGHGRLHTLVHVDDDDPDGAVAEYVAHVDAVRDEALAWLREAFAPREAKPANGAAKKKAKGQPAAAEG